MPVNTPLLDSMLATHIDPLLRNAGFRKVGTAYVRDFDGGTQRVDFTATDMTGGQVALQVLLGVDTNGYAVVRERALGMLVRSPLLWNNPLHRHGVSGPWLIDHDQAVGPILANLLRNQWLPEMGLLADLPWVERQLRACRPFNNWAGFTADEQARTLLFVIAAQRDDPDIDHFARYVPDADLWLPHLPRGS